MRRKKPVQPKPLKRRLHLTVDGQVQEWSYQITRRGVRIRDPHGFTSFVPDRVLLYESWDPAGTGDRVGIAPSLVKAYIQVVFVEKGTWDVAQHVGALKVDGTLVYKDRLTAVAETREQRDSFQRPVRDLLEARSKHRWFTVDEIEAMYRKAYKLEYRSYHRHVRRDVVDILASMHVDGLLEYDGNLGDPGVKLRLRHEHRRANLGAASVTSQDLTEDSENSQGCVA